MREYETTLIVQPEISSEGTEAILQKMDGVLEQEGATRLMCTDLGKRKLAYEIAKFQKGHYYVLSFLDNGKVVAELERNLRIEESVLRFMTVKVEDEVGDIEARKSEAEAAEIEQRQRADEKAAREAEEAKAREEVERQAAEEARASAAAASSEDAAAASSEEPAAASSEELAAAPSEAAGEAAPASKADAPAPEAPAEPVTEAAAPEEKSADKNPDDAEGDKQ